MVELTREELLKAIVGALGPNLALALRRALLEKAEQLGIQPTPQQIAAWEAHAKEVVLRYEGELPKAGDGDKPPPRRMWEDEVLDEHGEPVKPKRG